MGRKKKEHITFDRMADKRFRINKKAYIHDIIKKPGNKTGDGFKSERDWDRQDIYWIGGSPYGGKSTVTEILAERYGFDV